MEKTAATVLQELMTKSGKIPEYECVAKSGPQHSVKFEYRCIANGVIVKAKGKTKKLAKQEVARKMLNNLFLQGMPVPHPYARPPSPDPPSPPSPASPSAKALPSAGVASASVEVNSYVALLKELCIEYNLGTVEYDLVGDAGPPHQRWFTIKAQLGPHVRLASSNTKKQARQSAAEQLYTYLRENLARLTKDFVVDEALARAHERAMERYVETRTGPRLDLGQKISEYHIGVLSIA
ncbi:unnamed protein product [Leptidea sinapis]|uniref:DRBM domain-containing protein n=1 Tax=Leptidea sinapis TaxID=189913 RepID=A0A5E4R3I2_9NEOP|nr:unnamed protein product [Leptidea sinapis]